MMTRNAEPRWVSRCLPISDPSRQCRFCGSFACNGQTAECMLCGTVQCHGNGLGDGCCAVCHHGYLPGWSRGYTVAKSRTCTYKGCDGEAVGTARKRAVCMDHAQRIKVGTKTLAEYVIDALAVRDSGKGWQKWTWVA